jgi:hypothetical protein
MWQIDRLPGTVVVSQATRGKEAARLLESTRTAGSEAEILRRIVGMAEVEPPAEIEQ